MNTATTTTPSAADATAAPTSAQRSILVWDAPVRVFHWLLAGCFAGAYLTSESERWQLVHITCGYTLAGLIAFRLVWGLIGTRHARFASFVRGPQAAFAYLRSLVQGKAEHYTGHNPAGALAIVGLLGLGLVTAGLGWAAYNEFGGDWVGEVHGALANLMLGVVIVHLLGVVVGSLAHRENLVRSMLTGRKSGAPAEAIGRAWRVLAALIVAAVLGFWWLQWHNAPAPDANAAAAPAAHAKAHTRGHDRDNDD